MAHLHLSFFLLLLLPKIPANRLLTNRAGLHDPREPRVHTAAVIGMSAGEDPQLVPVLIFVQADGTHITLVSLAIVLGRNLFQLFFGQPIPPVLFLEMDPTNCRYGSRAQNEHCQNPTGKDEEIGQKEATVRNQKHLSPLLVDEEGTQVLRALLADEHRGIRIWGWTSVLPTMLSSSLEFTLCTTAASYPAFSACRTLRSNLQSNLRTSAMKTDPLARAGGGGAMGLQALAG